MNEQEFEERLRVLAREHNEPPPVPRETMWARIASQRAGSSPVERRKVIPFPQRPAGRLLLWVTGIAALLLLGIGIGRFTTRTEAPTTPSAAAPRPPNTALRLATTEHMSRVETFLTAFKALESDTAFLSQARDLLTSTGLLLDRPGVTEPQTRALLEDLELILIQIVQLGTSRARSDRDLIDDGLQARQVLPRLRREIPAGPPRSTGAS